MEINKQNSNHMQLQLYTKNKYECTIDQEELTDAAVQAPADASFSLTRWQHFVAWNDIMAAIFKVWRQLKKSDYVNWCIFIWRTLPLNFIMIRFEKTEL